MHIVGVEPFDREALLAQLRTTRLKGHGQIAIYSTATLALENLATDQLTPAQRYVLKGNVSRILRLREQLMRMENPVDIFALDGGLWLSVSDDGNEIRLPVIPPIVEESTEPDGRRVLLINDGMHRVYAARSLGLPISVVVVRGVPQEFPYYAYALPGGWNDVQCIDELTDDFKKKSYRDAANYKALFRDFNAVFEGVQEERKKTLAERVSDTLVA